MIDRDGAKCAGFRYGFRGPLRENRHTHIGLDQLDDRLRELERGQLLGLTPAGASMSRNVWLSSGAE